MNRPGLTGVIYAKDLAKVTAFYEKVFGLVRQENAANFVLLASTDVELAVVQIPESLAASIEVASPPLPREEVPLKLSLHVLSIEQLRRTVVAMGGSLKPAEQAWSWRSYVHLDGADPEGNILQFREDAT